MKIKELDLTSAGTEVFLCSRIEEKIAKTGKRYYDVEFRDATGTIGGKVWNVTSVEEGVVAGELVDVCFSITEFNNALQINATAVAKHRGNAKIEDFYPKTKLDVEKMWSAVLEMLDTIQDTDYKAVIYAFASNEDWVKKFKGHSAAAKVHHAFVGGLLQHTLFVMRVANSLAKIYQANRDLAVAAAFLHDVGKLVELSTFPTNDYTNEGRLYGHISEGAYCVRMACDSFDNFPEEKKQNLVHCILAHHGSLEFGSPVVPCLKEAWIIHLADLADSRMEIVDEGLEKDGGSYNRYLSTVLLETERGETDEI